MYDFCVNTVIFFITQNTNTLYIDQCALIMFILYNK